MRAPVLPRPATALLLVPVVAGILAACGGGATVSPATSSPSPTAIATPTTPATPAPTKVPGGNGATPPAPGTFETPWGEAWDALPPGFPVPPESTPADPADPAAGPVSGAFVIDLPPADAAVLQEVGLIGAGYSTEAVGGPSEDGSIVIDSVGLDPACRVRTTVRPLGGMTIIEVLLGASCPWG